MNRYLSGLCREYVSCDTDYIANVQEFFKHNIIKSLVFGGAEIIPAQVDLDSPGFVLQLGECSWSHDPPAHDTSCNGYVLIVGFISFVVIKDIFGRHVDFKKISRIRIEAQLLKFFLTLSANDFLLAQLHDK